MRFVKALCGVAALTALLVPVARADEWNKKTILTFSGPVQIPGVTLTAGTYVFKLADLQSNRHVVQVFDKDEKKLYGTILAIPEQKLDPSDKPVVMFAERPAGSPQAVKAWFYPGETIGNEFVYPKDQAMKIARDTHQSVLSMDETSATSTDEERRDAMKSAKLSRVDESGTTTAYSTEQSAQAQPMTTTAPATSTASAAPAAATTTAEAAAAAAPQTTTSGEPAPAPTTAAPTTAEVTNPRAATTTASADAQLKNSSGNVPMTQTSAAQPAPVGTSGEAPAPRRSLPRTASSMTLFELFSIVTIAGGLGLRRLRAGVATK
jgi:hypothetical protein